MPLRALVIALALVVALVAWLTSGDDDEEGSAASEEAPARIVSAGELASVAATIGQPIYWAGPILGTQLELTENGESGVQVRYLEDGAAAGEESAESLTIGSYPLEDPAAALDAFAAEPGAVVKRAPDGREVAIAEPGATSAYFASPDNSVQVEVYDPSPQRALGLALSGRVRPAD